MKARIFLTSLLCLLAATLPACAEYYTWDGHTMTKVAASPDSVETEDWGYLITDGGKDVFIGPFKTAEAATKDVKYYQWWETRCNAFFHENEHVYANALFPVVKTRPEGPIPSIVQKMWLDNWKSQIKDQMIDSLRAAGMKGLWVIEGVDAFLPGHLRAIYKANEDLQELQRLVNSDQSIENLGRQIEAAYKDVQASAEAVNKSSRAAPQGYKDFAAANEHRMPEVPIGEKSFDEGIYDVGVYKATPIPYEYPQDGHQFDRQYGFWQLKNAGNSSIKLNYQIVEQKLGKVVDEGTITLSPGELSKIFPAKIGDASGFRVKLTKVN